MTDVTCILNTLDQGDMQATEQLLPLVYEDLRRLAVNRLAEETPDQTLQPTALVHEAYLRLVGDKASLNWEGRAHFFAAAAEAMRRILVENARRKQSLKRGGDLQKLKLDNVDFPITQTNEDLLNLDEALNQLASTDKVASDLVQLRYFGGLSMPDAAKSLGLSLRSAERMWTYARAWLHRKMSAIETPQ